VDELSIERRTGYGYEQDLSAPLQEAKKRFEEITKKGRDAPSPGENLPRERAEVIKRLSELKSEVAGIIESQDEKGRWIVKNDRYRKVTPGKPWTGEYETKDRISSALFNRNVGILCEFLELVESLQ
jgi:hypothetical protein